jgi:hypothetical protein
MEKKYLSPAEVEEIYNLDRGTLANWRTKAKGPAFNKCGRKILYSVIELDEYMQKHKVRTN